MRDPRVDPRPGDVLREGSGPDATVWVVRHVDDVRVWYAFVDKDRAQCDNSTLSFWRREFEKDTVLHAAGEGEPCA